MSGVTDEWPHDDDVGELDYSETFFDGDIMSLRGSISTRLRQMSMTGWICLMGNFMFFFALLLMMPLVKITRLLTTGRMMHLY